MTLWPRRAVRLSALLLVFALCSPADDHPGIEAKPGVAANKAKAPGQRTFRTFLPKLGEPIDAPSSQVVQILLDRQDKGEFESYMVQILFRGKPSDRSLRVLTDRVEIDFYDTGKPTMRLARIRGGVVEASSVDEFYYKNKSDKNIKRMVRLTLFMHAQTEIKFRDTLDRTLIHFRLPKADGEVKKGTK
ncbi:MAG: hypothetical protein ABIW76_10765 [Fibrobacteria bacterium]